MLFYIVAMTLCCKVSVNSITTCKMCKCSLCSEYSKLPVISLLLFCYVCTEFYSFYFLYLNTYIDSGLASREMQFSISSKFVKLIPVFLTFLIFFSSVPSKHTAQRIPLGFWFWRGAWYFSAISHIKENLGLVLF